MARERCTALGVGWARFKKTLSATAKAALAAEMVLRKSRRVVIYLLHALGSCLPQKATPRCMLRV